ncbi:MAG: hypothetical protein ACPHNX_02950, partial [Candidatus Kariarchaeum pelagius]
IVLKLILDEIKTANKKWENKNKIPPLESSRNGHKIKIKNIEKNSLYLFYSTPNTVMDKLKNYIYIENKQQRIDDFFENEGQD